MARLHACTHAVAADASQVRLRMKTFFVIKVLWFLYHLSYFEAVKLGKMPEVIRGFGARSKGHRRGSGEPDLERGVVTGKSEPSPRFIV
jgi:hypothetical protein